MLSPRSNSKRALLYLISAVLLIQIWAVAADTSPEAAAHPTTINVNTGEPHVTPGNSTPHCDDITADSHPPGTYDCHFHPTGQIWHQTTTYEHCSDPNDPSTCQTIRVTCDRPDGSTTSPCGGQQGTILGSSTDGPYSGGYYIDTETVDPPPTIYNVFLRLPVVCEDSGTLSFFLFMINSEVPDRAISVDVSTVAGTATAGVNYVATNQRITIPPTDFGTSFQVTIINSGLISIWDSRSFSLRFSNPVGLTYRSPTVPVTIRPPSWCAPPPPPCVSGTHRHSTTGSCHPHPRPPCSTSGTYQTIYGDRHGTGTVAVCVLSTLTVQGAAADEGAPLRFDLTLSAAITANVVVDYATVGVTASEPADFLAPSGQVTIPAGDTQATISVFTVQDLFDEPDETLTLTLTGVTGGTLGALVEAEGTIVDDDPPPVVSVTPTVVAVGEDVSTPLNPPFDLDGDGIDDTEYTHGDRLGFSVRLDRPSEATVTVRVRTVDGTAAGTSQCETFSVDNDGTGGLPGVGPDGHVRARRPR